MSSLLRTKSSFMYYRSFTYLRYYSLPLLLCASIRGQSLTSPALHINVLSI